MLEVMLILDLDRTPGRRNDTEETLVSNTKHSSTKLNDVILQTGSGKKMVIVELY